MFRLKTNTLIKFGICFVLVYSVVSLDAIAQQMTKISGKMTCAYTDRQAYESGYTEGHFLSLAESDGINISAGANVFMDGAQVVNFSFADLVKGNGPHQGYVKLLQKDDVVISKWQGKITTIMSDEGTPLTTFDGTYSYVKGLGKFNNIQGKGTFRGKFISQNIYTVEWEGEYSVQ